MKNRKLALSIAAAAMATFAVGTGNVLADGAQPWHVTGQFGTINLDDDRNMHNNDVFWGASFGRFIGNNLSLDFEYDTYSGEWKDSQIAVPGSTYNKWKFRNLGGMFRYYIGDAKVRPFIAAGMGSIRHANVSDTGTALSMSAGAGLIGQFSDHLSARLQVLYRTDNDESTQPLVRGYGDVIYSVGLSFDFGGKAAAPPPPPPPPPPPAAAPPNPDLDGDGVLNERDKCPNTRKGAVVDLDGCEVEAVISLEGVHFDFDKATLRPEAKGILDQAAALLDKHERVVVEVAGHTDSVGSDAYNQALSVRRADSVKNYLVSKGVNASRLTARGYGESQPVASNDTDAGRAENRRVELIVLDR